MRFCASSALALLALGVALGLPAPAWAETETLVVKPGQEVTSETVFEQGKKYDVKVTGSIRFASGDDRNPGTCHVDAMYTICPPEENFRPDPGGEGLLVRRVDGDGGLAHMDEYDKVGRPGYSSNHSYSFVFTEASGRLGFFGYPFKGTCFQPCSGEITIKITPPEDAADMARVTAVSGEVTLRRANGATEPLARGKQVGKGDAILTGIESEVSLKFPDGTLMLIKEMSELHVSDVSSAGQRQTIRVSLKIGEVAAEIAPQKVPQCDFRIQLPGSAASVRGTKFSAFYDPIAKVSLYWVREGIVEVSAGSKKLMLGKGREVEVARGKIGKPAGVGKAGARGGVNRATATRRVLDRIGKSRCKVSPARSKALGTAPARGGWKVSVKLTGAAKGKSKWTVKGRKVKPANRLARRLVSDCR